jgi:hypothetical protein
LAIQHASLVVTWQENMLEDDMPPRWMWTLDEELNEHFQKLRSKRKHGDDEDDEPESVGPMLVNEYAKTRGRNAR